MRKYYSESRLVVVKGGSDVFEIFIVGFVVAFVPREGYALSWK